MLRVKEPEEILLDLIKTSFQNAIQNIIELFDYIWLKILRIRRIFRRIVLCKLKE